MKKRIFIFLSAYFTFISIAIAVGPTVTLNWTDGCTGETNTKVWRCTGASCANYVNIGSVASNISTYVDASPVYGIVNNYKVTCINGSEVSPDSNIASITPSALSGAPTGLTVTIP